MLRRTRTLAVMLSALMVGTAGAQVKQQGSTIASARTAIDGVWSKALAASRIGDATAMSALYTSDAMLIDPSMATVSGRDNIQKAFLDMMATTKFVDYHHTMTSFDVSGDLAVETGTFDMTLQERGKQPQTTSARYTLVFKQVNGQWLIAKDVATPNPPRK